MRYSTFEGKSIAVLGLGRTGLSVAQAVKALGGIPTIFDEKPAKELGKPELLDAALADGFQFVDNWNGLLPISTYSIAVANPAIDQRSPMLAGIKDAGIEIWSEIEFAYRISKAPILAITGTNGKSTSTVMTYLLLQACGFVPILCGNIFGSGYPELSLTEAALKAGENEILVAEVSSFQLEWVKEFRPIAAAITNIQPDHQERYDSFADYRQAKWDLAKGMTPKETLILNTAEAVEFPSSSSGPSIWTFGENGLEAQVSSEEVIVLGQRIDLTHRLITNDHQRRNVALATLLLVAAMRWLAGNQSDLQAATVLKKIQNGQLSNIVTQALKPFQGLSHRMEVLGSKHGIAVINNSMCTNPAAVIASAKSLNAPVRLLIGGVNKQLSFEPLGEYLKSTNDTVYLFGRDALEIKQMLNGQPPIVETLAEAFALAANDAQPGETIMLAPGCASSDQFRDFRDRGDVFKRIVKEWMEN